MMIMQALRLVNTSSITKAQWLDWRKKGITGTDVGAICGVDQYRSPMHVYLDKIGEAPEVNENDKMLFGKLYEDVISNLFAQRNGLFINRGTRKMKLVHKENAILQHPDIPWALANIDRFILNEYGQKVGVLEVKTASVYFKDDWENGNIPEKYMLQLQWYMFVTGMEYGYFVCECDHEYFQHRVDYDDELIQVVINNYIKPFWDHVQNRIPPAIDGSVASGEVLKYLYPEGKSNTEITLPQEAIELLAQYKIGKDKEANGKIDADEAKNKLIVMLGDNEVGRVDDIIITYKNTNQFDDDKLAIDHPDLHEKFCLKFDANAFKKENAKLHKQYSSSTGSRRFNVKEAN